MKTWFVTGASRGIGREIVRAALESGDQVVATARNPSSMGQEFNPSSDRFLGLPLDVTDTASISAAVDLAVARFGTIDVLVNNAGYGQLGFFEQVSRAAVRRQFETNVFGAFEVTRQVLPILRRQRSGHILTLSSIGGLIGFSGSSIYCATKFALEGWSESLGIELAPFGISTTLIEPGFFRTDFLDPSSVAYGDLPVEDYSALAENQKSSLGGLNHQQLGDPRKLGDVVVRLVRMGTLPVRFAAGSDAYQVVKNRASDLDHEAELRKELSCSTDHQP